MRNGDRVPEKDLGQLFAEAVELLDGAAVGFRIQSIKAAGDVSNLTDVGNRIFHVVLRAPRTTAHWMGNGGRRKCAGLKPAVSSGGPS